MDKEKESALVFTAKKIYEEIVQAEPGEKILLINDFAPNPVYNAFLEAVPEGCEVKEAKLKPGRKNSEPIPSIGKEILRSNVVIAPTRTSITHSPETGEAEEKGVRIITLPGITEEVFLKINEADFEKIEERGRRVLDKAKGKDKIRVETPSGTDIVFSIKGREWKGLMPKKGKPFLINLPEGEVFCAPLEGSANGKIVVDWWADKIKPSDGAWIEVKKGKIIAWNGSAGPFAEYLSEKRGRIIAEFGVGTNKAHKKPIGNILHDEKIFGTVHIAFGNNTGFGGKNKSKVHADAILLKPEISIDGKKFSIAELLGEQ